MSAGTTIADFLELLDYAQERYATAQDEEQEANAETQDILHSIEFQWYDPRRTARLTRKLSEIRQKRRIAKEDLEIAGLIVNFAHANGAFVKALKRLHGEVQSTERIQAQRSYQFRTDVMYEYLKPEDSAPLKEAEPESGGGQGKEAHSE